MRETDRFQYKVFYSRRRTMSIVVSPDKGIIVKAPLRTPSRIIEKFVVEKSGWIIKTLQGFKSLKRIDNTNGSSDGDNVLLFGKEHKLSLIPASGYFVRLGDNSTIEAGYAGDMNPAIIKAMLENWVKFIARKKLTIQFRNVLEKYKDHGFTPSGFTVRTMKKRWGSCSYKGKIGISYDLIKLDEVFADYVIIHELCHLKHHNHGAGFYRLLSEVYPDWKKARNELKLYLR
ncbi:MAG: SprT family zinc-dependent metalloprotease [Bacteroidota bacterium]|nr:SprT family zinc-dependent metalloprotease [Bacteroidota bacterium]